MTYEPVSSNISETTGATVPIFELDLTIFNTIVLSHNWLKSVYLFESYRAHGRTDRRTDGQTDKPSAIPRVSRAKTYRCKTQGPTHCCHSNQKVCLLFSY